MAGEVSDQVVHALDAAAINRGDDIHAHADQLAIAARAHLSDFVKVGIGRRSIVQHLANDDAAEVVRQV